MSQEHKENVNVMGVPIRPHTIVEALAEIDHAIDRRETLHIGVVNAAKIVNMRSDAALREAVLDSDVIYADGMAVVWASRMLGAPLPERVAGIDLMHGIMRLAAEKEYRVFCLGATQEVLDAVCSAFQKDYGKAQIVGARNGYFSDLEEEGVASEIKDSHADILLVAITSPKKERFMAKWGATMGITVVHGVGGSFDVVAGVVSRAPEAWQKLGMEWLYRVVQEPRRMWKRYLITNSKFLTMLAREYLLLVFGKARKA